MCICIILRLFYFHCNRTVSKYIKIKNYLSKNSELVKEFDDAWQNEYEVFMVIYVC